MEHIGFLCHKVNVNSHVAHVPCLLPHAIKTKRARQNIRPRQHKTSTDLSFITTPKTQSNNTDYTSETMYSKH